MFQRDREVLDGEINRNVERKTMKIWQCVPNHPAEDGLVAAPILLSPFGMYGKLPESFFCSGDGTSLCSRDLRCARLQNRFQGLHEAWVPDLVGTFWCEMVPL